MHPPGTPRVPPSTLSQAPAAPHPTPSPSPHQASRLEIDALKTERKVVLEREKDAHELANYLVSLRLMEEEQSGLMALASGDVAHPGRTVPR